MGKRIKASKGVCHQKGVYHQWGWGYWVSLREASRTIHWEEVQLGIIPAPTLLHNG